MIIQKFNDDRVAINILNEEKNYHEINLKSQILNNQFNSADKRKKSNQIPSSYFAQRKRIKVHPLGRRRRNYQQHFIPQDIAFQYYYSYYFIYYYIN